MDVRDFLDCLKAVTRTKEGRDVLSRAVLQHWSREGIDVPYCVLPGGKTPERMSDGAVGFDLFARAIVDTHEMDGTDSRLRKTLFDFMGYPSDERHRAHIHTEVTVDDDGRPAGRKLSWRLRPGDHVLVGVGVAFALPYEMFQWTAPRSGLAAKRRIQLGNAPGTIDSDYRGEAGLIVLNDGNDDFIIDHHMRIGQLLFQPVIIPRLVQVDGIDDLGSTIRGAGGFGSTGYGTAPS